MMLTYKLLEFKYVYNSQVRSLKRALVNIFSKEFHFMESRVLIIIFLLAGTHTSYRRYGRGSWLVFRVSVVLWLQFEGFIVTGFMTFDTLNHTVSKKLSLGMGCLFHKCAFLAIL